MDEMITIIYVLVGVFLFVISVIVLVKFFQIARDISAIREIVEYKQDKEKEHEKPTTIYKKPTKITGDLNDPETLDYIITQLNKE